MENSLNQVTKPTFHRKEKKTHKKSETGNAVHESLVSFGRSRRLESHHRKGRRKRREMKVQEKDHVVSGCEDHDEKAEVERKILELQRVVPGGESLGADKLFEETAGYILALQYQIKAMRVLASFLEGLEKEKRKFGG